MTNCRWQMTDDKWQMTQWTPALFYQIGLLVVDGEGLLCIKTPIVFYYINLGLLVVNVGGDVLWDEFRFASCWTQIVFY